MASVKLIPGDRGRLNAAEVLAGIQPDAPYLARTSLVSLEDTVNKGGGSIWPLEKIKAVKQTCIENDLILHLDGARLFNALVENGESPKDHGEIFDSISICLSKGLGTPIGSVLIGNKTDIHKAHRFRKVLGGGMRQAGILAAAGIYAMDHNVDRLKIDNDNARKISKALEKNSLIKRILPVQTNIVIFELEDEKTANGFLESLKNANILAAPFSPTRIRFVSHLDISEEHMNYLLPVLENLV
jgi:threonine aldolase